ncbi:MAG TPA: FecR domain-containing protein [Rhizomicrobium sp.]|nr:FecR domain-containing protein [Rhizomicrobium sp.]
MVSDNQKTEFMAAQWVAREDRGLRDKEEAELFVWLDESTANKVAYLRLKACWDKTARLAALKRPELARKRSAPRWSSRPVLAIAAALLIALLAAGSVYRYTGRDQQVTYTAQAGERPVLSLSDGSRIQLNTNTEVRTSITKSVRTVTLEKGEAYFDVVHDAARPFVVLAGNRRVTDLGTKFSVRRDGDKVYVVVKEGKVRVEPINNPLQSAVTPVYATTGSMVVAKAEETLMVPRTPRDIAADLSWQNGVLIFNDKTLGEAAQEFNHYNAKQIIVTGTARDIPIGGSFRADNIDVFASLVRNALGLKVTEEPGKIVISR